MLKKKIHSNSVQRYLMIVIFYLVNCLNVYMQQFFFFKLLFRYIIFIVKLKLLLENIQYFVNHMTTICRN